LHVGRKDRESLYKREIRGKKIEKATWRCSRFLDRISVTLPEEKLVTTRDPDPQVSVDLSYGVNQNMSSWA